MVTLTVRKLDDKTIERLKARARTRRHSLEAELREILIEASRQPLILDALAEADRIADREDPPVAGPQPPVDLDAVPVVGDACGLEIHALDLGCPAGGDQKIGALDALWTAAALAGHKDRDAVAGALDRLHLDPLAQHDALGL